MSLFNELKRRNVFRVGIAYAVAAWLLLQLTDVLIELLDLPDVAGKYVVLMLVIGFIPALIFAWAFEMTPEGIKRERDVDRSESVTTKTGRKLDFTIIGMLAAAVIYLVIDKFSPTEPEAAMEPTAVVVAEPKPEVKSIAVLPFVNMSSDPEQEYFSDGISEEILNALAKVKALKVAGRTSSFAFKGKSQDLRRIGEALGVNYILEGSVRKSGNMVRITAQLIQVEDGFHLWSESYDRELTNIFAIQDEIAKAILEQLKLKLLEGESEALAATQTDSQAYELYLLAKQRIYERKRVPIEAAVKMLDSALEIDPNYVPALAQRGIATLLLTQSNYGTMPTKMAEPIAKGYIDRAIKLDDGQADAWAALGLYHSNRPTEEGKAIEALEKALSINPNLINASNWLQQSYTGPRNISRRISIIEGMIERDPLYKPAIGNAILLYNQLGQFEKSLALIERVAVFMPDDPGLMSNRAMISAFMGDHAEAIQLYEKSLQELPERGVTKIGLGFALLATHQYEKIANDLMPPFIRIFTLNILGRTEEATISAYERAAIGDIEGLFGLLNRENRSAELVKYIEERWLDLDAFQKDYQGGIIGYDVMLEIALAYERTGNQDKFNDAIGRFRDFHEVMIEVGVSGGNYLMQGASYYALTGDFDQALAYLESVIEQGGIFTTRIAWQYPALQPLEGDPRFEVLQAKMIENLNKQRAELGLEPATI